MIKEVYRKRHDSCTALFDMVLNDARGTRSLTAWLVTRDPREYPDKVIAQLVTDGPQPYVLTSDILAERQALLPPDLSRAAPGIGPARLGEDGVFRIGGRVALALRVVALDLTSPTPVLPGPVLWTTLLPP